MTYVGIGQKEIKTAWPIEKGLTAGTQKQTGREMGLLPQTSSKVLKRNKAGIG